VNELSQVDCDFYSSLMFSDLIAGMGKIPVPESNPRYKRFLEWQVMIGELVREGRFYVRKDYDLSEW
jgi:hypothetical protein